MYHVVLFLHLLMVVSAFTLSGALHACEWLMRRASTVAELRALARPGKLAPLFGLISVLLLLFGVWLVHLSEDPKKYDYGDPFVWTGLLGLVAIMATGIALLGPAHERLTAAIDAAPEGPVPPALRTEVMTRLPRLASHANTFVVLAVVLNMTVKPDAAVAVLVLVAGLLVGVAVGALSARPVATGQPGGAVA